MLAISIVGPHGSNIASGKKVLEVRSWRPEALPIRDLLIVENSSFLSADNPIDLDGRVVAIVDVEEIHEWQPTEVEAACSNGWEPGYWAWTLSNVRPVTNVATVPAKRKLYEVDYRLMQTELNQVQRSVIKSFQDRIGNCASNRVLDITINLHPDRLTTKGQPILKVLAEDGIIRSQFETGTSNGGLSAFIGGERWKWESNAFGGMYDNGQASHRPKYGALNYKQLGAGASPRFGSSFFKLKPSVLDRTTFCYPESWVGPKEFGYSVFVENLIQLADASELDILDNYIEAHMHGSLSIRTDVESIVLDPCYKGTEIEDAAGDIGCKVEWHKGFMVQVSILKDFHEYRGVKYVQLAHEIAKNGVITPDVIGTAVNRKLHNDQDLKKVWHYLAKFGNLN